MRILVGYILLVLLLVVGLKTLCLAQQTGAVAVLLSREIAPYVTVINALEEQLGAQPVVRFFLDNKGRPYSLEARTANLNPEQFAALVAIGPEALRYLHSHAGSTPLVFGMVLNPHDVIADVDALCGSSLNLPIDRQFAHIRQQFPQAKSMGVLFDPANNQLWFDQASPIAHKYALDLVPIQVNRSAERLSIDRALANVDLVLFIPDRTIISPPVIEHVIKQSFERGAAVVGFNRFFLDSGAALAMLIDYHRIGEQLAELVNMRLEQGTCSQIWPPPFAAVTNQQALRVIERVEQKEERP